MASPFGEDGSSHERTLPALAPQHIHGPIRVLSISTKVINVRGLTNPRGQLTTIPHHRGRPWWLRLSVFDAVGLLYSRDRQEQFTPTLGEPQQHRPGEQAE